MSADWEYFEELLHEGMELTIVLTTQNGLSFTLPVKMTEFQYMGEPLKIHLGFEADAT